MLTSAPPPLSRLARPSGAFAMVAIDQRESLRTMFSATLGAPPSDDVVSDFKLAVAEQLAPFASAILFDRFYGLPAFAATGRVPTCARIMAADQLTQPPGGLVEDTDIDAGLDPAAMRAAGADALKLLVIWRGAQNGDRCVDLASRFMQLCRTGGLLGIVEAIVPEGWRGTGGGARESAIVDAARQLGAAQPDLYKCQVPFHGRGRAAAIGAVCEQIGLALPCPWVVLSQGVALDDFPHAIEIACRSGASGFLAGRGIWADAVSADRYRESLEAVSVPRLHRLADTVDSLVTPAKVTATSEPHES